MRLFCIICLLASVFCLFGESSFPGQSRLFRLSGGHNAEDHPYTLGIRDSIMIAHSFQGVEFGPAQNMHGATYTVDVDLSSPMLSERLNWVIDIGEFSSIVNIVLKKYNFQNLNELFPFENTTTEFMCQTIFNDIKTELNNRGYSGNKLQIKLYESHKAWAQFCNYI